jgi:hypothetical protein
LTNFAPPSTKLMALEKKLAALKELKERAVKDRAAKALAAKAHAAHPTAKPTVYVPACPGANMRYNSDQAMCVCTADSSFDADSSTCVVGPPTPVTPAPIARPTPGPTDVPTPEPTSIPTLGSTAPGDDDNSPGVTPGSAANIIFPSTAAPGDDDDASGAQNQTVAPTTGPTGAPTVPIEDDDLPASPSGKNAVAQAANRTAAMAMTHVGIQHVQMQQHASPPPGDATEATAKSPILAGEARLVALKKKMALIEKEKHELQQQDDMHVKMLHGVHMVEHSSTPSSAASTAAPGDDDTSGAQTAGTGQNQTDHWIKNNPAWVVGTNSKNSKGPPAYCLDSVNAHKWILDVTSVTGQYVVFDFGAPVAISRMKLYKDSKGGPQHLFLQTADSKDAKRWKTTKAFSMDQYQYTISNQIFASSTSRFWRLLIEDFYAGPADLVTINFFGHFADGSLLASNPADGLPPGAVAAGPADGLPPGATMAGPSGGMPVLGPPPDAAAVAEIAGNIAQARAKPSRLRRPKPSVFFTSTCTTFAQCVHALPPRPTPPPTPRPTKRPTEAPTHAPSVPETTAPTATPTFFSKPKSQVSSAQLSPEQQVVALKAKLAQLQSNIATAKVTAKNLKPKGKESAADLIFDQMFKKDPATEAPTPGLPTPALQQRPAYSAPPPAPVDSAAAQHEKEAAEYASLRTSAPIVAAGATYAPYIIGSKKGSTEPAAHATAFGTDAPSQAAAVTEAPWPTETAAEKTEAAMDNGSGCVGSGCAPAGSDPMGSGCVGSGCPPAGAAADAAATAAHSGDDDFSDNTKGGGMGADDDPTTPPTPRTTTDAPATPPPAPTAAPATPPPAPTAAPATPPPAPFIDPFTAALPPGN